MSTYQDIINFIEDMHLSELTITTPEFLKLLKASRNIYDNKAMMDALIYSVESILARELDIKRKLTYREKQIINLIGKGETTSTIANELNLSITTVETHRKNVRKKLDLKGHDSLFAFALIYQLQNSQLSAKSN